MGRDPPVAEKKRKKGGYRENEVSFFYAKEVCLKDDYPFVSRALGTRACEQNLSRANVAVINIEQDLAQANCKKPVDCKL